MGNNKWKPSLETIYEKTYKFIHMKRNIYYPKYIRNPTFGKYKLSNF